MPNTPLGPSAEVTTSGREYLHSRAIGHVIKKTVILVSTARDQGNTLRKGLALGKIAATGKFKDWDTSKSDGSQTFRGFLDEEVDMMDQFGNFQDRQATMVVWGRVKVANVFVATGNGSFPLTGLDGSTGCFFIQD